MECVCVCRLHMSIIRRDGMLSSVTGVLMHVGGFVIMMVNSEKNEA